jgi:hypothetical protein
MGAGQSSYPVCVTNPQGPSQYSPSDAWASDELLERIYDEIKPQLEEAARALEHQLLERNQVFWYAHRNILRVSYTENDVQKFVVLNRDQYVKCMTKLVKIPFTVFTTYFDTTNRKETVFLRVINNT